MNDEEARQVERELRDLFDELGLYWVIEEVDTAVAEGIAHEVPYQELEVPGEWHVRTRESRPRGKPAITSRALTVQERINYMIAALWRVVVETPSVHKASWANLNLGSRGRVPMIGRLSFVSDEEDSFVQGPPDAHVEWMESDQDTATIQTLLDQLRNRVDS